MIKSRQTVTVAALATVGALLFAFSVVAMAIELGATIGEDKTRSIGVTFTFDGRQCVGASDFRRCRWPGTIRDGATVLQTDVTYVDSLPPNVAAGVQIGALWSPLNPTKAWSASTDRAWMNSVGALLVSSIMLALLSATAIVWWRRYGKESKADRARQSSSENGQGHSKISQKSQQVEEHRTEPSR